VEQKGEIEDLVPSIYKAATGKDYPGAALDPMPLDVQDLALLSSVVEEWLATENPTEDEGLRAERCAELYKLLRTLLATSFKGLQSRNRSKQLDELGSLLKAFAFTDENDALVFAKQYLPASPATGDIEETEIDAQSTEAEMPSDGVPDKCTLRVIPINPDTTILT